MSRARRALVLFSGGLDSMLAAKLLMEQNIEVIGVCFESGFYNAKNAVKAAKALGIELKIIDISKEMMGLVKNPPSGYGKHLNPCIDCHGLMMKTAGRLLQTGSAVSTGLPRRFAPRNDSAIYNFIATGEVLGQRPFSQNRDALARVEKLAGMEILRPLSAKLLPETKYEKQRLVIRGRLLNISGRAREQQMELAKKYNLTGYGAPAGGCLLTDPEFSERLGKMMEYWPKCGREDVELLKHGRVFWVNTRPPSLKLRRVKMTANEGVAHEKVLIVVGRHEEDNDNLEKLAKKGDFVVELKEINGPVTIIRIKNEELRIKNDNDILEVDIPEKLKMGELKMGEIKNIDEIINIAGLLTGYYATKARGEHQKLSVISTQGA